MGCVHSVAQYANVAAAQWILNRVAPARKGRAVILDDFPSIDGPDAVHIRGVAKEELARERPYNAGEWRM